jgi:hypothetical protein
MTTWLLFLSLFSSLSQAGTLDCVGPALRYSRKASDGGAQIAPTIRLEFRHEILIDVQPFGHDDVRAGDFELLGQPRPTSPDVQNGNYLTSRFTQVAEVRKQERPVFRGRVACVSVRYVGPPIP